MASTPPTSADRPMRRFFFKSGVAFAAFTALAGTLYLSAATAKGCGSFEWAFLVLLFVPGLLSYNPLLLSPLLVAFAAGGILPRFSWYRAKYAVLAFLIMAVVLAVVGAVATVRQRYPCDP